MSAKICCMCQDNLALETAKQLSYFGRTYDEDGESPCFECIQEMEEAEAEEDES